MDFCKFKGTVVDTISYHGVSDDDLDEGLDNLRYGEELKENRLLHTHVNKSKCFGILEIIGFIKREGDEE